MERLQVKKLNGSFGNVTGLLTGLAIEVGLTLAFSLA